MSEIETARLWLRPLKISDLEDLARIYCDPEVMKYRVLPEPATREQTQERLQQYCNHWENHGFGRWATIYKKNQRFIGHCGLEILENFHRAKTTEVEINYLLERSYWGMGLAIEAALTILNYGFETLKLNYIVGIAKPENIASVRVMEKVGMHYEQNVQYCGMEWRRYLLRCDEWRRYYPRCREFLLPPTLCLCAEP